MDFREFLEAMFESEGKLQYGPGIRLVAWVDQSVADYYRKMIPKYHYVQPQMYKAHITIVRTGKETPTNMDAWGKHEGEIVPFRYDTQIRTDGTYWYLNAYSERIGEIREELGLPRFRFGDLGADRQSYHITIANNKGQNEMQGL